MKLKRKITTDSVMEELKKKFNRTDLTNEGFLDWLTGSSKKADTPTPNPDSGAETAKGPEPAAPEAPSTTAGPTPNAGRGGFGRMSAAMVGPTDADKAAGEAKPENTPGAIAIEKPGDIAKVDTTTAKGIGGTDSKLSFDQKQDAAAKIDASDKAHGMTPKEPAPAKPEKDPYADWGGNSGEPVSTPKADFKFNSKGGKVSADELAKYREHTGNANVTLGQYMNARDKKTAVAGGANDPDVIQKKLDAKAPSTAMGPAPGGAAYRPASGTTKLKENLEQFVRGRYMVEAKKEEVEEAIDNANPGLGARHNPKKTAFKTELHKGSRNWGGNQKRSPSTYAEEATKIVKKKVMEKKKEQPLGSTSTGKNGETITLEPTKPELTGYH